MNLSDVRRVTSRYLVTVLSVMVPAAATLPTPPANAQPLPDTLVVRGDESYPPFEYTNGAGRPEGFTIDIITAVARKIGVPVDIELGPWWSVREQLERGEIDVLAGMYESPERDLLVDFSLPHLIVSYSVFARTGSPIRSIEDATGTRIIVQEGDIAHDYVIEHALTGRIILKTDLDEVLEALANGEGDCALVSLLQGEYFVHALGIRDIQPVGVPFIQRRYCMAVTEGDSLLLAQLNEGLSIIKATGEYDDIYERWFGAAVTPGLKLTHVLKDVALLVIPVVLLVLAGYLWNLSLRRQVARQTAALSRELEERIRAEAALSASQQQFALFMDNLPAGAAIRGKDQRIVYANAYLHWFFRQDRLVGMCPADVLPPEGVEGIREQDRITIEKGYHACEETVRDQDGNERVFETHEFVINRREDGQEPLIGVIMLDVTKRKQLESQLLQAQKMETVGRLAGGVAHDFNNLLTVIMGNAELAIAAHEHAGIDTTELAEIKQTAERAAQLVRQLLTFSRNRIVEPSVVDINRVLADMTIMLRRLIGEDVILESRFTEGLWPVRIDPAQVEQVISNLAVNARDAMPGGGILTIETVNIALGGNQRLRRLFPGAPLGDYVSLRVSDTGTGIPPHIQEKIFEPFFTTKELGKGSGLGLSICYGIVTQNGGFIRITNSGGRGAAVDIILPRAELKAPEPRATVEPSPPIDGTETILVVEDEDPVRAMTVRALRGHGYEVFDAAGSEGALGILGFHPDIRLMVTDMVMPHVGGAELAGMAWEIMPDLPVLFVSGYSDMKAIEPFLGRSNCRFLQKPYLPGQLLAVVHELVHAPAINGDDTPPGSGGEISS